LPDLIVPPARLCGAAKSRAIVSWKNATALLERQGDDNRYSALISSSKISWLAQLRDANVRGALTVAAVIAALQQKCHNTSTRSWN
jgi:hypothetical protein